MPGDVGDSLRVNVSPVVLTSLTTAIGFLSMNFSDAPPFRDLGNITALGVIAALFYSTALLPAFLAIVPIRIREAKAGSNGWINRELQDLFRRARGHLFNFQSAFG